MPIFIIIIICMLFWADDQRSYNQDIVADMANRICTEAQQELVDREIEMCTSSNIKPSICYYQAKKSICPTKEELSNGESQTVFGEKEVP